MSEQDEQCQRPCHPSVECPACADYWGRMIDEGFWDEQRERWTDKAMKSMTTGILW